MTAVLIAGLTKRFGAVTAVSDVTFEAPSGQVTGFIGANGAGKTTTLRMLLGLVRPTSGTALIGGQPYAGLTHPRQTVGAMLEASGAHPGRTGRDHLRVLADVTGVGGSASERVDEVLELVDLTGAAGRRVKGYSLGMRQRLGLAGALLADPGLLVLDEPANGLDPAGVAWLRGLLRDQAGTGRTVLISSHVLSEMEQVADRVVVLHQGQVRFEGSLAELGGTSLEQAFLELTGA
jgi:ABC-2 type transport system ATP-binding protein